jgi:hypothetical protein
MASSEQPTIANLVKKRISFWCADGDDFRRGIAPRDIK